MSDSPLLSKTKDDLAAIAHVMGLLTPQDTSRMTKAQLLAYLHKIEAEAKQPADAIHPSAEPVEKPAVLPSELSEKEIKKHQSIMIPKDASAEPAISDTEPSADDEPKRKRGRPRKVAVSEPAPEQEAEVEKKKRGRPKRAKEASLKEVVAITEEVIELPEADATEDVVTVEILEPDTKVRSEQELAEDATTAKPASRTRKEKHTDAETDDKTLAKAGELATGVLEIMPDGYGFLRIENYLQSNHDVYVPPQYIRRFGLRNGDLITGPCRQQRDNDRYRALYYIKDVNGTPPEQVGKRPHFDRLTPIYPNERYVLETVRNELSTRIIDLVSPIGKGQRGMIVSPPKAGKTILMQKIANAISINNPDAKLFVLLIDERPEEVTDMQRSIKGEVVFSTFDKTPENHVKVTELVLERAMRLVELKQDVVILLDSITRMGRAYNLTITPTGRTLSGGLDPGALYGPKRFFGAARNIENGGSLTIIATALIETGSRMDEVIFEEFKGTGNMEVLLDRKLSEKRIFPAIDITRSSTRREELLLSSKELDSIWAIRKAFGQLDTAAVTETIINLLLKTRDNQQFIQSVNVSFNDKNLYEAMRGQRPGSANGTSGS